MGAERATCTFGFDAKEWKKHWGKVKMILCEADKITTTTTSITTGGRGVQTELKTNHEFKEFLLVMLLDFVVSLTSSRASSQFNL